MGKEQKAIVTLDFGTLDEEKYLVNFGQYEIFFENGKTYFVKKKPTYLKTYEECCELLNVPKYARTVYIDDTDGDMIEYETSSLILEFRKLLICRDAYWNIVGEQMGLGKSWVPNWKNAEQKKYCIHCEGGNIQKATWCLHQSILAFPTTEIRDVFYENFKHLIEKCKEFL